MLYPKTQGILNTNINAKFAKTAFFLVHPKLSIEQAIRFSNTAVTVEKLAKVINTKKSEPHKAPIGILRNISGKVIKINDGP